MPGRTFNSTSYRYGFNGKENDPESVSTGEGLQDYGMRIYNPSLGKFLSVDPLQHDYPELTTYQFASNTPIWGVDLDGLEVLKYQLIIKDGKPQLKYLSTYWGYDNIFGEAIVPDFSYEVEFENLHYTFTSAQAMVDFAYSDHQGYTSEEKLTGEILQTGVPVLMQMFDEALHDAERVAISKQEVTDNDVAINTVKLPNSRNKSSSKTSVETPQVKAQASANNGVTNTRNATLNRVKLRKSTVEKIKENQPRNDQGQMIDPNTKQVLVSGKIDIGHKTGQEWRVRRAMHENKGSTRKEVIEAENDPDLYHLEDRSSNRSHQYEQTQKK